MISFTISGQPVPFARARSNGAQRFTAPKQRAAMNTVRAAAIKAKGRHVIYAPGIPLQIEILASWEYPKSWPKARKVPQWHTSRPDADNIGKLVCDAVNGIIYTDDAQIATVMISKVYGENAFTTITISPMGEV